jgi:hypothetical protein
MRPVLVVEEAGIYNKPWLYHIIDQPSIFTLIVGEKPINTVFGEWDH